MGNKNLYLEKICEFGIAVEERNPSFALKVYHALLPLIRYRGDIERMGINDLNRIGIKRAVACYIDRIVRFGASGRRVDLQGLAREVPEQQPLLEIWLDEYREPEDDLEETHLWETGVRAIEG